MKHTFSNFNADRKWYIIHTKEHLEKKIIELLSRKKIESYHPVTKTKKIILGEYSGLSYHSLLPEIIFIYITQLQIPQITNMQGVCNFLYWHSTYATVSNHYIEEIKSFVAKYENVAIEKTKITVNTLQTIPKISENRIYNYYDNDGKSRLILSEIGIILMADIEKNKETLLLVV